MPDARGPARTAVAAGDPHVVDVLEVDGHAVRLRRHVLAFFQGNRFLLPALVSHVVSHVAPGDRVIDLYAGTGLFSVAAGVARGATVLAVEGDRIGAADLAVNAERTAGAVKAVHEGVETFLARQHNAPNVLIVDPPRTGMSKEALDGAIALKAPRGGLRVVRRGDARARRAPVRRRRLHARAASSASICSRTRRTSRRSPRSGADQRYVSCATFRSA